MISAIHTVFLAMRAIKRARGFMLLVLFWGMRRGGRVCLLTLFYIDELQSQRALFVDRCHISIF